MIAGPNVSPPAFPSIDFGNGGQADGSTDGSTDGRAGELASGQFAVEASSGGDRYDRSRWTVVVSRGQSRNPEKRGLESAVAELATKVPGVTVIDVPHLYDLPSKGESLDRLRGTDENLLVVSWIYGRAARWVLDRSGVRGSADESAGVMAESNDEVQSDETSNDAQSDSTPRVTDEFPRPNRRVVCLEFGQLDSAGEVVERLDQLMGRQRAAVDTTAALPIIGGGLHRVDETTSRRWYPVIDFDRCTNCMECVDFCLFGVYGLDGAETILVEQPDNCRKGCPACSRVCPENAIIFPQHKAPAIAGAEVEGAEGFKIDLSQLFGAPAGGDDPIATAARERDEQLLLTGRDAVGIDEGLARRRSELAIGPKDELDDLIDQLDALDV